MESFIEYMNRINNNSVGFIFQTDDNTAAEIASQILDEGKLVALDSRYSYRYDIAKQPNQQNHTHIYLRGKEICIVNTDGTPSHNSSQFSELPRYIQAKIREKGLVETPQLITESFDEVGIRQIAHSLSVFWLRIHAAGTHLG